MSLEVSRPVTTTSLERDAGRNPTCSKTRHPGLFAARPARERPASREALHALSPVVMRAESPAVWEWAPSLM